MPNPMTERAELAFRALHEIVPDPVTYAVLRVFCENRRDPARSLAEAAESVLDAARAGRVAEILEIARKPLGVWRQEQRLQRELARRLEGIGGSELTAETIDRVRERVGEAVAALYPRAPAGAVVAAVQQHVRRTSTRLEVGTSGLVQHLAVYGTAAARAQ